MVASGLSYDSPNMFSTNGPWLTPRPSTNRPGCSAVRVRPPPSAAIGSRAWILAMPVPITSFSVASSSAADSTRQSFSPTSGMNSEP